MSENKSKTLSVCMLVTDIDSGTGGIQKNSRLLLEAFTRQGIRTFICARNYNSLARSEERNGTLIHRSPAWKGFRVANSLFYLLDVCFWLIRNRNKYDIVHCQQVFGATMVATIAGSITRKPVLTRVTLTGYMGEAQTLRRMPFSGIRRRLLQKVSRWVVLSREMKDEIESLGISPAKIRIIHNATQIPDETCFGDGVKDKYRNSLTLPPAKIAVYLGRLSEEKNLNVLIDAWKIVTSEHKDAHLILVGEGGAYQNVENELRSQVTDLSLDGSIHFVGHVDNAKEYVLASDIFVLPSSAEGLSNALVEAFACGATIIASDINANKEICEDGVNSRLFSVGVSDELAAAINELFNDPATARRLATAARKKAEAELAVDKMVDTYIETYLETIAAA